MILLLESLHADAEALLEQCGTVWRAEDPNAPDADVPDFAAVQAIVTRGRGNIRTPLMDRCANLRLIARAGTGLDNLDSTQALERGLSVVYAPGANAATVAEHTIALLLDLARGITLTARQVAAGRWEERKFFKGQELNGLRLGLIGCGNIGQRVAILARAFGMEVVRAAREGAAHPEADAAHASLPPALPLQELLASCDAISLHAPLTPATRYLIGAAQFAAMKPGAFLINTARGELIEPQALRDAVTRGTLGGFAADVLEREPPVANDPLLHSDRVVLTPHVGALTDRTYRLACVFTAENIVHVLRDETPDPRSLLSRR